MIQPNISDVFVYFKLKSRTAFYFILFYSIFNHRTVPSTSSSVILKGLLGKKSVVLIKDNIDRLEKIELFKN